MKTSKQKEAEAVIKMQDKITELTQRLEDAEKELGIEKEATEIISMSNKLLLDGLLEAPLESITVKWDVAKMIFVNGRLATEKHQLYGTLYEKDKYIAKLRYALTTSQAAIRKCIDLMAGSNCTELGILTEALAKPDKKAVLSICDDQNSKYFGCPCSPHCDRSSGYCQFIKPNKKAACNKENNND